MRAWNSPEVSAPDLPAGPAPRVHDTASGRVRELTPSGPARLYVCGITPYDATHLGHASTYLAFDLLNRAWRSAGHEVRYVQNVTDVDDPLLERATATGVEWTDLAERETELFRTDMTALRVLAPDHFVGAVEAIDLEAALIDRLRSEGAVYDLDGDLYMDVHADPRFGEVSGLDEAAMLAIYPERGGDPDRAGKKHPLDALVWRAERPGEPSWDPGVAGIVRGRPGWHVECAAIALHHLGETFDVQGGGSDLVFPHHEMSAGHAQVAHDGAPFARNYVHAGMVGFEGEKMSKSKGNLVLVSRLREAGVDPMAIRLALLAHHYRSDWEWTDQDLGAAEARLASWRAAAGETSYDAARELATEVRRALADDLDAPAALAATDAWAVGAEEGTSDPAGEALARAVLDASLGIAL